MKRTKNLLTFRTASKGTHQVEIPGYHVGGLFVHNPHTPEGRRQSREWVISHAASGLIMLRLEAYHATVTHRAAMDIARYLDRKYPASINACHAGMSPHDTATRRLRDAVRGIQKLLRTCHRMDTILDNLHRSERFTPCTPKPEPEPEPEPTDPTEEIAPGITHAMVEDSMMGRTLEGICGSCAHIQGGCEPDAEGYRCEACGKPEVQGICRAAGVM